MAKSSELPESRSRDLITTLANHHRNSAEELFNLDYELFYFSFSLLFSVSVELFLKSLSPKIGSIEDPLGGGTVARIAGGHNLATLLDLAHPQNREQLKKGALAYGIDDLEIELESLNHTFFSMRYAFEVTHLRNLRKPPLEGIRTMAQILAEHCSNDKPKV